MRRSRRRRRRRTPGDPRRLAPALGEDVPERDELGGGFRADPLAPISRSRLRGSFGARARPPRGGVARFHSKLGVLRFQWVVRAAHTTAALVPGVSTKCGGQRVEVDVRPANRRAPVLAVRRVRALDAPRAVERREPRFVILLR